MDAQRNRERLLEVAREAFIQQGPEAAMGDIARRAEVGPGTLYLHFPDSRRSDRGGIPGSRGEAGGSWRSVCSDYGTSGRASSLDAHVR